MTKPPDVRALQHLNEKLVQGHAAASEAVLSVAQRAALEANAFFATRKTPISVAVRQSGTGAVLVVTPTKRLIKGFRGRSPEKVVREILERHLAGSKEQVSLEVARSLR